MKAFIKHISYYLPNTTLSNAELTNKFPEWSIEKVTDKLGIKKRHIANVNETSGDLAIKAAEKLFTICRLCASLHAISNFSLAVSITAIFASIF